MFKNYKVDDNDAVLEDDYNPQLTIIVAEKYLILRLFKYGKKEARIWLIHRSPAHENKMLVPFYYVECRASRLI